MPWFRKKKAKAATPPPAHNNNGEADPGEETKAISLAFTQSVKEAETAKKGAHEKATNVRKKADECIQRLSRPRTEGAK